MIKKSSCSTLLIIQMFRVRSYLYSQKISLINNLITKIRDYENNISDERWKRDIDVEKIYTAIIWPKDSRVIKLESIRSSVRTDKGRLFH